MTLEQKVGQIVFVDVTADYVSEDDGKLQNWIRLVRDYGVGGIVSYGGTPRDLAALVNRLQKVAQIPVLFASDFEGGPGQQVRGATEFPAKMAFAAIDSEQLMYRAATVAALEGRAMGIRLTYSPVVDISTQPENPSESVRSFGGDVELLAKLVRSYVRTYREHGMLTSAKHFPGRGNVRPLPDAPQFLVIEKPARAVEAEDLRAFRAAIEAGVAFVMSEHIAAPSIARGSDLPASVEHKLARGWLRDKLGFQGLLTTDDLWYDHVVQRFGSVTIGVKALQAGHDILLKPKDPVAMIQGVVAAVRKGEVPADHIDQAVRKLLVWKARLNLHKDRYVDDANVASVVGNPQHWALAREVADRSLTVLKNDRVLPLPPGMPAKLVNIAVQKLASDPSPDVLAARLTAEFPGTRNFTLKPDVDPAVHETALSAAKQADLVTVSLFCQRDKFGDAAPLRERDQTLLHRIFAAKPGRVIVMSYGNPHLIRKLEESPAFVVGYGERGWFGNQEIYFDSFIRLLKGQIKPAASLPVHVSNKYPIGAGIKW
jgi:beta-N-acetylhexosaminidase